MRVTKGLAALLILVLGLVGIPAAFIALVGNPLPAHLSWQGVVDALTRPDDGSVLIGLIGVIGWVAWSVFAVSVLIELVNVVSGFRLRVSIPGLAAPQRLAAGLLLAVVALVAVPAGAVHATPLQVSPTTATVSAATRVELAPSPPTTPPRRASVLPELPPTALNGETGSPSHVHVVERGDDLWSLAEHYYGQGRDWRKIAAANPARLSGGPDRLLPGWRLAIPDVKPPIDNGQADKASGVVAEEAEPGARSTVVRSGDTLSSIAQEAYGQPARWVDVFDANRAVVDDPDEIEVGDRLLLPSTASAKHVSPVGRGASPTAAERAEVTQDAEGVRTTNEELESRPTPRLTARSQAPDAGSTREQLSAPTSSSSPAVDHSPSMGRAAADKPTDSSQESSDVHVDQTSAGEVALGVGAVGGLLAAGVIAGLALRRRAQLQLRPVGRRIQHAPPAAQAVETALGHRQEPLTLETLDLATRAIAAHCHRRSAPLPSLRTATVGPDAIELRLATPASDAPVGFQVSGDLWRLESGDASYLSSVPGVDQAARPYPALASMGYDEQGRLLLVDLEAIGLLSLDLDHAEDGEAFLAAMAVEMSFSVWSDEMILTLVGSSAGLPEALGKHNVARSDDLDGVLDRLEQRARVQRKHQSHESVGQNRLDPDRADPWAPEIVLINQALDARQAQRLLAVVGAKPAVTMAAVVAGQVVGAPWSLQLRHDGAGSTATVRGTLLPSGLQVTPQLLAPRAQRALNELVTATGSEETTPAPWWDHDDEAPPVVNTDNVTHLGRRLSGWGQSERQLRAGDEVATADLDHEYRAGQSISWSAGSQETPGQQTSGRQAPGQQTEGSDAVSQQTVGTTIAVHAPILRLLGPVELAGARGAVPPRAGKQCLEYCGWLLEHPGTTAMAMASALVVAEGTRRSNMSRLRTWLGVDGAGEAYLPDAYSGRILLHPSVSSDWQRLQILTAVGVNRTSTSGLQAALELVRGAPLADAAPGQWHWAEELRTDMVSVIRDIGVEVTTRALAAHDIDLARWAAARALAAAPGDELLMAARIRTEHQAGNTTETERLTLQLAAQARSLGVDLDSETVVLLQEVMEGRPRARLA